MVFFFGEFLNMRISLFKKTKTRFVIGTIAAYLSLVSTISFSCFIIEESLQIITFSNFTVKESNRYDLLADNLNKMTQLNKLLDRINNWFMWINPFGYVSYGCYIDSTNTYIQTLQSLVFAKRPELLLGQYICVNIKVGSVAKSEDEYLIRSGRIEWYSKDKPESEYVDKCGIIKKTLNRYIIQ